MLLKRANGARLHPPFWVTLFERFPWRHRVHVAGPAQRVRVGCGLIL